MTDCPETPEEHNDHPTRQVAQAKPDPGFLSGVQYLYFLRFSLLYLFAVPLLAVADRFTGINSITRGIFTPAAWYDYLGEAFFLCCVGVIALVTSRLVVMNGEERYGVEPPHWLCWLLGEESDPRAGWMLVAYQVPGLIVLGYLVYIAHREGVEYSLLYAGLMSLAGIVLAFLFWGSLNVIYYWTADDGTGDQPRTILFPRVCLGLKRLSEAEPNKPIAPPAFVSKIWARIASIGPGYSSSAGKLYSGHQFATIAALGYLLVYAFLFPLTSPFTNGPGYTISLVGFFLLTLALTAWVLFGLKPTVIRWAKFVIAFELAALSIGAGCLLTHYLTPSQTFPVLCSVLVLLSLVALVICGVAFLIDRIHIPVIGAFAALLIAVHTLVSVVYLIPGLHLNTRFGGFSDHYFEVRDLKHQAHLATPDEILKGRNCGTQASPVPCPIIVVSATGGGIHAAAWTTLMLTELEDTFKNNRALTGQSFSFHNNVALFSTVSGGSVGLLPFLNEYYGTQPFSVEGWEDRMFTASSCSSLEAVAWGLEYRDFDIFMAPEVSWAYDPSWDRSAALEAGFHRHLFEAPCKSKKQDDAVNKGDELTLGAYADGLRNWIDHRQKDAAPYIPAFSMNTTAAETGGRFLLSDYRVAANLIVDEGVAPSEDFLSAYGARPRKKLYPDIRLSTAARLSATFPYVSSAARSDQMEEDAGTLHFVDGGYYDNDGIASVVEFLLAGRSGIVKSYSDKDKPLNVPILLIEIRDGPDLDDRQSPEQNANAPPNGKNPPPSMWNTSKQLSAPLGAFWSAGHEAISRRDRRELEVLMDMLSNQHVAFKHIVLDYREPSEDKVPGQLTLGSQQPLSWFLTPSQIQRIKEAKRRLSPCLDSASQWTSVALAQTSATPIQGNTQVESCATTP